MANFQHVDTDDARVRQFLPRRTRRLWGEIVLALTVMCAAAGAQSNEPVAIVGGQTISQAELEPLIRGQVRQLRAQEFEVQSRALEELVNRKVLEAEAKKQGLPVEKLVEKEVKLAEPSDAEVE